MNLKDTIKLAIIDKITIIDTINKSLDDLAEHILQQIIKKVMGVIRDLAADGTIFAWDDLNPDTDKYGEFID